MSDAPDVDAVLSRFFGREVQLACAAQNGYTIDQYHPDVENLDPEGHRDEVTEVGLGPPSSTSGGSRRPFRQIRSSICFRSAS